MERAQILKRILEKQAFSMFNNEELDYKYAGFHNILKSLITEGNSTTIQTEDIQTHFGSFPFFKMTEFGDFVKIEFDIVLFANNDSVKKTVNELINKEIEEISDRITKEKEWLISAIQESTEKTLKDTETLTLLKSLKNDVPKEVTLS